MLISPREALAFTSVYVCMYVCVRACVRACVLTCMHACKYVCVRACMHARACVRVCVRACMRVMYIISTTHNDDDHMTSEGWALGPEEGCEMHLKPSHKRN